MTTFSKWLGKQPRGTIARLVREVPVSHTTVWKLRHGGFVDSYDLACRLSAATGGEVTAATLCGSREPKYSRARTAVMLNAVHVDAPKRGKRS